MDSGVNYHLIIDCIKKEYNLIMQIPIVRDEAIGAIMLKRKLTKHKCFVCSDASKGKEALGFANV